MDNNNTASSSFAETGNITAAADITPTPTPTFAPEPIITAAPQLAAEHISTPPTPTSPPVQVANAVPEASSALPAVTASVMPIAAPAVAHTPMPPKDFSDTLQQAGLILIQTAQTAQAPSTPVAPTQPLGRKPKPAQIIADEPLQMIETKPD
jgi:ribonuclease E